jgi:uncharacterized protein (TIGR02996 family)
MSEAFTLIALYAALEADPADTVTLLALADWFEEHDQDKPAECVRWLAETGKVPYRYTDEADILHHFDKWKDGWYWWTTASERKGWGYPKDCRLPRALWGRMKHTFDYDPRVFKEYPTVRGAIEAVIAAWKRRPPKPPRKKGA